MISLQQNQGTENFWSLHKTFCGFEMAPSQKMLPFSLAEVGENGEKITFFSQGRATIQYDSQKNVTPLLGSWRLDKVINWFPNTSNTKYS